MKTPSTYRGQIATYLAISVSGWIGYLLAFGYWFPSDYNPDESRSAMWGWLIGGTFLFIVVLVATLSILRTPREWRSDMAIAGIAPALLLDSLATTFFTTWFSSSSSHVPTAYSTTVLGGAGAMLLVALLTKRAKS